MYTIYVDLYLFVKQYVYDRHELKLEAYTDNVFEGHTYRVLYHCHVI